MGFRSSIPWENGEGPLALRANSYPRPRTKVDEGGKQRTGWAMTVALFYLEAAVGTCQSQGREKNYGQDGQTDVSRSIKGQFLRRLVSTCAHDLSTQIGLSVLKRDPGHYSFPCSTQNSKTQSLKGQFFTMGKLSPPVVIGCSRQRAWSVLEATSSSTPPGPTHCQDADPWRGIGGKT